jgi:pyrroloquinoline quinone biosynthesis protein D
MTPHLPRGVRLRQDKIRNRWVLLAPERIFEIDDIGVEILKRCDGRTLDVIVADLSQAFGAPAEAIKPDVESFLKGFAEKKVLEMIE